MRFLAVRGEPGALQARDDGLERGGHDVGVAAHAEQRALADAQFEVGHGAGIGAGGHRVLMVVQHADRLARGLAQPFDEGVDRAVAGAAHAITSLADPARRR
jgi:hypothetical protein